MNRVAIAGLVVMVLDLFESRSLRWLYYDLKMLSWLYFVGWLFFSPLRQNLDDIWRLASFKKFFAQIRIGSQICYKSLFFTFLISDQQFNPSISVPLPF